MSYNRRECIILMGIQGSGKSTFFAHKFQDTHIHINLDMLHTRHREKRILKACLDAQQPCVIDNTNVFEEERKVYIDAARQKHFRVIGYFLRSSIRDCISRNDKREGQKKIPHSVIASKYNHIQLPSLDEGFDELYYVSIVDGEFCVEDFKDGLKKDEKRPKIVTRKLSIFVSDKIDWEGIISSLAWNMNLAIEFEVAPKSRRPLVLVSLIGKERDVVEFSRVVQEKIQEAIEKTPSIDVVRGYFSLYRWSKKDQAYQRLATDMGLKIDVVNEMKTIVSKTIIYELEGRSDLIKEFVEKTSPTTSF